MCKGLRHLGDTFTETVLFRSYIQSAAVETNQLLYNVIQNLPDPKIEHTDESSQSVAKGTLPAPTPSNSGPNTANTTSAPNSLNVPSSTRKENAPAELNIESLTSRRKSSDAAGDVLKPGAATTGLAANGSVVRPKSLAVSPGPSEPQTPIAFEYPNKSRPGSPSGIPIPIANPGVTTLAQQQAMSASPQPHPTVDDPFDIRETVNVLTLQFVSEHEETRIAALEWLSMLHHKAPSEVSSIQRGSFRSHVDLYYLVQLFARDNGTFPALLKTLSDPSEEVSHSSRYHLDDGPMTDLDYAGHKA
jgi:vacuole morphology and inheritance protein 14